MKDTQKHERMKELMNVEIEFKKDKNFTGLIYVYDEIATISSAMGILYSILPKKIYCLLRLHKKFEAEKVIEQMKLLGFFINDELLPIMVLLYFFKDCDPKEFGNIQINAINELLNDPNYSIKTKDIIFDYFEIMNIN